MKVIKLTESQFKKIIMFESTVPNFNGGDLKEYPMFTSCCPGWVHFVKTEFPVLVKQVAAKNATMTAPILLGDNAPRMALIKPYAKKAI